MVSYSERSKRWTPRATTLTPPTTSMREFLSFFRNWAADPRAVGAIAPSGPALAELIACGVTRSSGPVIELGAGTGVFTRALLGRGVREEDLTLVEYRPDFVRLLRERFPKARVLRMDATRLRQFQLFENAPVGAVVSGLPLVNMQRRQIAAILAGAFSYIRPGGSLYQFTYCPWCPVPRSFLARLGLQATSIGRALLNFPPATVYQISRQMPFTPALDLAFV